MQLTAGEGGWWWPQSEGAVQCQSRLTSWCQSVHQPVISCLHFPSFCQLKPEERERGISFTSPSVRAHLFIYSQRTPPRVFVLWLSHWVLLKSVPSWRNAIYTCLMGDTAAHQPLSIIKDIFTNITHDAVGLFVSGPFIISIPIRWVLLEVWGINESWVSMGKRIENQGSGFIVLWIKIWLNWSKLCCDSNEWKRGDRGYSSSPQWLTPASVWGETTGEKSVSSPRGDNKTRDVPKCYQQEQSGGKNSHQVFCLRSSWDFLIWVKFIC